MRLIDADALIKEIEKHMENGFPANENLSLYAIACLAHAQTAYDIDAIKNKIEHEADYYDAEVNKDIAKGLYIALKIIKTFDILKK